MNPRFLAGAFLSLLAATAWAAPAADVLATASMPTALAPRALVNGLAAAGARIVAVGQRGHILYSDDHGASWRQASVPVSSDLTAACFADAMHGWAVGHDGVVLHTADAGASWTLQMDGRTAARTMLDHYREDGADPRLHEEARRMAEQGPDKPFLDVWFADARHGYVAGAFGLLFATSDGGKSWQPMLHAADNPRGLHLNAIRKVGDTIYIAGEQGLLLRKTAGSAHFAAMPAPYQGSWFGVAGDGKSVLAFGLRGNAYRSSDNGSHWEKVETGVQSGLTAGAVLADGRMVLVSQAGQVLASSDGGASFQRLPGVKPGHSAAVIGDGKGGLLIGGARGLRQQEIK